MNSTIGLKSPGWNLNESKYPEIDDFPLMGSIGPVMVILALYLMFVIKVGPAYMKKREAYKLTHLMVAYNGIQVAISVYLVGRMFLDLLQMGLVPKVCYMDNSVSRRQILLGTYLYFSAKVTELLDTVFFVLRKKDNQISFLHLYHHTVMVIGTWTLLKYWPSHTLMFIGFLNSLVHVFMYTYYGLAAFGPRVTKYLKWKKYMTKFQLIQFVSIIIQYVSTVRVSDCPPERGVAVFVSCNTAFFLVLFLNFYRQSYNKQKGKALNNCDTLSVSEQLVSNDVPAVKNINSNGIPISKNDNNTTFRFSGNNELHARGVSPNKVDKETTISSGGDISNFIAEISITSKKYSLKSD